MVMFALAVAIVVVVGVSGQSKCTPDQWEGVIEVSAVGRRGLSRAYARASYDATNTRTASIWKSSKKPGEIKIVTVFKQGTGTRYFIRDDKCCKMTLKGDFKKFCVPAAAKDVGSFYYGLGDNKLTFKAYEVSTGDKMVGMALTLDNVPVSIAISVKPKGEDRHGHGGFSAEAEFFDLTAKIANASVFDVPDSCNDGCGKQEALMYLIQDSLMWVNPFDVDDLPIPIDTSQQMPIASLARADIYQKRPDIMAARSTMDADMMKDAKLKFQSRMKKFADRF